MALHNKTLLTLASKLGLGEEDKLVDKAAEFERLLQTKSIAGSQMTDTSKIVICLDLAAGIFGTDFDMKTAVKYSGLKQAMYTNNRKIVQNLLELNEDKLTTMVLCNTLQCTGVQSLADKILKEYQNQAKMEVDLNLPQNVCMAVYQACRISKVKVPKAKLIEKSRLKPGQWTKLDAVWTKLVDENFATSKKKRGKPGKSDETEESETADKMDVEIASKKDEVAEPKTEPYQDWKKRVLDAAHKELRELQKESEAPRRSPRKTPQKSSPVKNPKTGGVRLLFPLKLM